MSIDLRVTLEQLRQRRGTKWTNFEPDVLPAWIADMDFPIAAPIREAIAATVERNDMGYASDATVRTLAEVFAQRMSDRFDWQPDPGLVMPVSNLIQTFIAGVASFSQPAEGVVVQTPIYPPFMKVVEAQGRRLVENRLIAGPEKYEMDIEGLRATVDKDTRLLLFCNPHNPSGRVFERAELEKIAELVIERDLVVVSDEVHADLTYDGHTHIPLASLGPEIAARTVTVTSASKAFNIAGLKCAIIHFGSRELRRRQASLFSQHLLGTPNILGIEATLAAWRDGEAWLQAVRKQLADNRQSILDFTAGQNRPGVVSPQAGYLAWLDCGSLELAPRPYQFFLDQARVALSDGGDFGRHTGEFVRLNFATSPEVLKQILQRMGDALPLE